jgi:hypothetical protein
VAPSRVPGMLYPQTWGRPPSVTHSVTLPRSQRSPVRPTRQALASEHVARARIIWLWSANASNAASTGCSTKRKRRQTARSGRPRLTSPARPSPSVTPTAMRQHCWRRLRGCSGRMCLHPALRRARPAPLPTRLTPSRPWSPPPSFPADTASSGCWGVAGARRSTWHRTSGAPGGRLCDYPCGGPLQRREGAGIARSPGYGAAAAHEARSRRYAGLAAEGAARQFAWDETVRWYEAAAAGPDDPEPGVLASLATAYHFSAASALTPGSGGTRCFAPSMVSAAGATWWRLGPRWHGPRSCQPTSPRSSR